MSLSCLVQPAPLETAAVYCWWRTLFEAVGDTCGKVGGASKGELYFTYTCWVLPKT